jgi:sterol-4alpha-carboxylate 3-dehydrogenase (decarboxylating)
MAEPPSLGPVLLTGGNGFIGYHIIAKILEAEPECSIHSLDVNPSHNRHPGANVHYHKADLASAQDVARVVELSQPVTIFHTASPEFSDAPISAYHAIIVDGTRHLLDAATKVGTVRALVNTSSSSVIHDNLTDLVDATEDLPILRPPQQKRVYSLAKADAEEAILAANRRENHGLLTCSLRPCLAFGEHDTASLGKMVAVALQGRSRFQMGNGGNLFDFVYVGNLADAHLLTARALLAAWGHPRPPTDPVDGECFNVTNDDPWRFWDFQRAVSAHVGHPVRPEDIVVIPKWVGLTMGFLSEWLVWAISRGTRTPNMTREGIRFSTMIRTLNMEKAKRVLGYRPVVSMEEGLERSVQWFMKEREKRTG